jgi:NADH-quinone oxidoreductase subunit J
MMLKITDKADSRQRTLGYALAAMFGSIAYLSTCVLLVQLPSRRAGTALKAAFAEPARYGEFIFRRHWLSIEVISLLLLVVLVGALILGISERRNERAGKEET